VTQLRGLRPLRDGGKVLTDATERVKRIEIDLHEAAPPSFPALLHDARFEPYYYGRYVHSARRCAP
jgi:hypothetical protein